MVTIFKPSDWTRGKVINTKIEKQGLDPKSLIHLKLVIVTHESSSYQVFHSYYKEMKSEFSISTEAKNLFLSLAESIAQTLNVTSCYVCGGPTWETIGPGEKIADGLLSKSSCTMVLPPGQKTVLGLPHPYVYEQPHHQAAGCC
jgi:hypothetical protein